MLGIIGLIVPIMQGWLFILIAIPLISPEHGKKITGKAKEWWRKRKEMLKMLKISNSKK
jgi:hypothetical protein